MSISLDERREEWAEKEEGRVEINPYTGLCCIKLCSWPQKEYELVRANSWIRFRLQKRPDSVQLQCLRCWPTGSTTGGLQYADNRSDGDSGEFWYDHKTLVYQFAWFSTTHTCTPHSHYACMSESYWKGNHFPCTSLATISMSSIYLLILLLPCAATYC